MEKLKWEKIASETHRLPVYGGWIIRTNSSAVTFVPDPKHMWNLYDVTPIDCSDCGH